MSTIKQFWQPSLPSSFPLSSISPPSFAPSLIAMFLRLALIPDLRRSSCLDRSGVDYSFGVYRSIQFHVSVLDSWDFWQPEFNGSGPGFCEAGCQGSCSQGSVIGLPWLPCSLPWVSLCVSDNYGDLTKMGVKALSPLEYLLILSSQLCVLFILCLKDLRWLSVNSSISTQ